MPSNFYATDATLRTDRIGISGIFISLQCLFNFLKNKLRFIR